MVLLHHILTSIRSKVATTESKKMIFVNCKSKTIWTLLSKRNNIYFKNPESNNNKAHTYLLSPKRHKTKLMKTNSIHASFKKFSKASLQSFGHYQGAL